MSDIMRKDIFISYKNDGSGDQFAERLCADLENLGYSVYFNPQENRSQDFPERLKNAILSCVDFILILSQQCLEHLMSSDPDCWVRKELLIAKCNDKHIIPILMDNVDLYSNAISVPKELDFLPNIDALRFPAHYISSPFAELTATLCAKQNGYEKYRDSYNNNPKYRVWEDYQETRQKAENGDVEAMFDFGMMCHYGAASAEEYEAKWDYENAAYWMTRVIEREEACEEFPSPLYCAAHNVLASMYYQGQIPREPQSYEKAFKHHETAAIKNGNSATGLGFMLRIGLGCDFNFKEVLDHYNRHIGDGDDIAVMELANFLTTYGKFQEAFSLYESIETSSPEADYQIGMLYKNGVLTDPPKPDYIQAAYYLRNAADNNHLHAAYEYGLMCFRPTGRFKKDFRTAERYLKMAADGGMAKAQYILGFMYKAGHVTKDLEKAVLYLEQAKDQGHTFSALELASIYQQPECKNYERAYQCAEIAASHGVAQGEMILGNLLFWGRGCEANMNKAYEMFEKAASHGIYYANIMMRKIESVLRGT